jgi:hypothetical protein
MIAPGLDVNLDHELNRGRQSCDQVTQSDSVGLEHARMWHITDGLRRCKIYGSFNRGQRTHVAGRLAPIAPALTSSLQPTRHPAHPGAVLSKVAQRGPRRLWRVPHAIERLDLQAKDREPRTADIRARHDELPRPGLVRRHVAPDKGASN